MLKKYHKVSLIKIILNFKQFWHLLISFVMFDRGIPKTQIYLWIEKKKIIFKKNLISWYHQSIISYVYQCNQTAAEKTYVSAQIYTPMQQASQAKEVDWNRMTQVTQRASESGKINSHINFSMFWNICLILHFKNRYLSKS